MTQWVAQSLLSKKQCLIYSEIKAEVRRGSALRQLVRSAALHTALFCFVFQVEVQRDGEWRGRYKKAKGEVADENAGLRCR